ncbi:MAG: hypothetical protein IPK04_02445 [Bdellovibrionales bacterium]|nr:hypothetical protein [Bdellovibrionales bacterium]
MKFNMTKAATVGLFLVFGAVQAQAGECVMQVTRVPCSDATKDESFKKCGGQASCPETKKTGSEKACESAAKVACENKGVRQKSTKSKTVTAKFDGKDVNGGKDVCGETHPDFNKCN